MSVHGKGKLTKQQIDTKLATLVGICNELDEEAKLRFGPKGFLFFEADGNFHLMSGDSNEGFATRQKFIRFSSKTYCKLGSGAW